MQWNLLEICKKMSIIYVFLENLKENYLNSFVIHVSHLSREIPITWVALFTSRFSSELLTFFSTSLFPIFPLLAYMSCNSCQRAGIVAKVPGQVTCLLAFRPFPGRCSCSGWRWKRRKIWKKENPLQLIHLSQSGGPGCVRVSSAIMQPRWNHQPVGRRRPQVNAAGFSWCGEILPPDLLRYATVADRLHLIDSFRPTTVTVWRGEMDLFAFFLLGNKVVLEFVT